jgi:TRAP-type C4-dicarboxylate transport system permease small subunit
MRLAKAARPFETGIYQVSRILGICAIIFLVAMMMLTVIDVVMRLLFDKPVTASVEFTEYLMLFVAFLGLAWCAIKGGHIKVEIIVGRLSVRVQEIINSINALIVMGLCFFLGWMAVAESSASREVGFASQITGIPDWPFYILVGFGFAIMFFAMTMILVHSVYKVVKNEP